MIFYIKEESYDNRFGELTGAFKISSSFIVKNRKRLRSKGHTGAVVIWANIHSILIFWFPIKNFSRAEKHQQGSLKKSHQVLSII